MLRTHTNDLLLATAPSSSKTALGLVSIRGEERLALKLTCREFDRGVSVLLRPFLCPPGGLIPSYLRPAHVLWPEIVKVALPGILTFPPLRRSNIDRIPKASFVNAGATLGGNYTAHCF